MSLATTKTATVAATSNAVDEVTVTSLAGGGYVVSWKQNSLWQKTPPASLSTQTYEQHGYDETIRARMFGKDGVAEGGSFSIGSPGRTIDVDYHLDLTQ
jgi:hypothetical protein